MMWRRWGALAVAATVAFGVASCASIPQSGSVQKGSAVQVTEGSSIEFVPAGPEVDGSIEQILRGFIDASSSPQNDYAIARLFLTPALKARWDPNVSVTVDDGNRNINVAPDSGTTVEIAVNATVDARGIFTPESEPRGATLRFSFERVDNQWRISDAPQGVVIDRFTFDQVYASHPLYFFDPGFTTLVPDVRWFPEGSALGARIARSLLEGPAPWLAQDGALTSSFPAGTALAADSLPVLGGTASLDLTEAALAADKTGFRRMTQQAMASLVGIGGISRVDVLVAGVAQILPGNNDLASVMPSLADARPLVVTKSNFGFASGNAIQDIAELSAQVVPLAPSAVALAPMAHSVALLTGAGVSLVRAGSAAAVVDARPNLIAPAIDSSNFVWSVPRDLPGSVLATGPAGASSAVATAWPAGTTEVDALALSRDGCRLAALLQVAGTTRLVVASVHRDSGGRPVSTGTPITLGTITGSARGLAWADATSVVSLTSDQAIQHTVGGRAQPMESLQGMDASQVAGANSRSQVRVRTADGRLLTPSGNSSWQTMLTGVLALGVAQ
jgi:hypothetical protein